MNAHASLPSYAAPLAARTYIFVVEGLIPETQTGFAWRDARVLHRLTTVDLGVERSL